MSEGEIDEEDPAPVVLGVCPFYGRLLEIIQYPDEPSIVRISIHGGRPLGKILGIGRPRPILALHTEEWLPYYRRRLRRLVLNLVEAEDANP